MIDNLAFKDITAAQSVDRWHMICMRRRQNVAEHSFNVAMIAAKLAASLPTPPSSDLMANLYECALCHDLHETEFGDVPTPTKALMAEHGVDIDKLFDDGFWAKRGGAPRPRWGIVGQLVKIADKIDAILFHHKWGMDQSITDRLIRELKDLVDHSGPGIQSTEVLAAIRLAGREDGFHLI